jgi:23S rRNA pseudouridine1911/1915/1917 synthase
MITHPAPGNSSNTLVNALLHHTNNNLSSINKNNRPGIIHRLDKNTSGLLVIAKNNEAYFNLSDQFKDHSIVRKYYAIVWGVPQNQIIKGYIERNKINRKKMSFSRNKKGKYSETIINLKKNYGICSLIECTLKTGRTHQIRLHMTYINSPLIGDQVYGKNKVSRYIKNVQNNNKFFYLKNFNRQALHAYNLGFIHPTTKKYIEFKSKIPEDLLKLLEFVVKY